MCRAEQRVGQRGLESFSAGCQLVTFSENRATVLFIGRKRLPTPLSRPHPVAVYCAGPVWQHGYDQFVAAGDGAWQASHGHAAGDDGRANGAGRNSTLSAGRIGSQ